MPPPLDGCLVGIDGYTNTYFVTDTYVTNFAGGASLIDPRTLRVADTNLMAYYYGYGARADRIEMLTNALPRTLTWNGGSAGRLSSGPWSGGVGLHTTPFAGDILVFPQGGSFENDIGGLVLGGLVFESAAAAALTGGQISLLDGGDGVTVAGTGAVTVEAPLSFGSCSTSTVPVSVCAGGSVDLAAVSGGANVLFAGPGAVSLHNAATATCSFTLSNAVSVTLLEGFRWPETMSLYMKDGPDGPPKLFLDAANTERFQNVEITGFISKMENDKNPENPEQFAAMTYILDEDTVCVVYRGTDDSIRGWKEDCNLAKSEAIPSQIEARDYLSKAIDFFNGKRIFVAGHSKGGNIAMYACAFVSEDRQNKIEKLYNLDGPGFSTEILNSEEMLRMKNRLVSWYPHQSIVGMLFYHYPEGYSVVKSSAALILQHDLATWRIQGKYP